MEAGRELDALVAEKVMGLPVMKHSHEGHPEYGTHWTLYFGGDTPSVPPYSTDMAAAWEVVEHFDTCELKRWWTGARFYWTASLTNHDPEMYAEPTEADTAPLAICLAALAAVGAALPQKAADS